MQTARRLDGIGEYYFSQKLREIDELNRQGKNVINLGIGSPDLPPHPDVIRVLQEESAKPNVHAYQSYKGSPALRNAVAAWYRGWYGVDLNPDTEILPLIGSKEGIMHICMTYLDEGDGALVPNPGYPTYRSAVKLAGGTCVNYSLTEEGGWYPDFGELERLVVGHGRIKLMWVNYPHMPTGKLPDRLLFEQLVAFGKKHDVLIHHRQRMVVFRERQKDPLRRLGRDQGRSTHPDDENGNRNQRWVPSGSHRLLPFQLSPKVPARDCGNHSLRRGKFPHVFSPKRW